MSGHKHNPTAGTQNQGNTLGDRSCVRQSKLYRTYESGNGVKALLGSSHLAWDPNVQQGAYTGQKVYDHNLADPLGVSSAHPGTFGRSDSFSSSGSSKKLSSYTKEDSQTNYTTTSSGYGSSIGSNRDTGYGAPRDTGYGAPRDTGYGAPRDTGYGAPRDTGYGAPRDTGYGAPQGGYDSRDSGYGAPRDTGYGAPRDTGYGAPRDTGYGAPRDTGYGAPRDTGYGAPGYGTPGYGAPRDNGYGAPSGGGYGTVPTSYDREQGFASKSDPYNLPPAGRSLKSDNGHNIITNNASNSTSNYRSLKDQVRDNAANSSFQSMKNTGYPEDRNPGAIRNYRNNEKSTRPW